MHCISMALTWVMDQPVKLDTADPLEMMSISPFFFFTHLPHNWHISFNNLFLLLTWPRNETREGLSCSLDFRLKTVFLTRNLTVQWSNKEGYFQCRKKDLKTQGNTLEISWLQVRINYYLIHQHFTEVRDRIFFWIFVLNNNPSTRRGTWTNKQ